MPTPAPTHSMLKLTRCDGKGLWVLDLAVAGRLNWIVLEVEPFTIPLPELQEETRLSRFTQAQLRRSRMPTVLPDKRNHEGALDTLYRRVRLLAWYGRDKQRRRIHSTFISAKPRNRFLDQVKPGRAKYFDLRCTSNLFETRKSAESFARAKAGPQPRKQPLPLVVPKAAVDGQGVNLELLQLLQQKGTVALACGVVYMAADAMRRMRAVGLACAHK